MKNTYTINDYNIAIEFIEYMAVYLEAGYHIQKAFFLASKQISGHLFSKECAKVIKCYQLGDSFQKSLLLTAKNSKCKIVEEIFENMALAIKLGIQLSKTIRELNNQLRFQANAHLEELAHKAPIKMIFPLVMLIFPVLFTLLGTKTIINFVQSLGV